MKTIFQFLLIPAIAGITSIASIKSNEHYSLKTETSSKFDVFANLSSASLNNKLQFINNLSPEDPTTTSYAFVDAASDVLIPSNHIYTRLEAIELRDGLVQEQLKNPTSLAISWALLRYYSCAPNFVGGNMNAALQKAANIYTINNYLGCLAYEYAYAKASKPELAETWYKKSLISRLPNTMVWHSITYNNTAQFGVKVSGNFNNWKTQSMYETLYGNYERKIMSPKCENCQYKLIVDYQKITVPTHTEIIVAG